MMGEDGSASLGLWNFSELIWSMTTWCRTILLPGVVTECLEADWLT